MKIEANTRKKAIAKDSTRLSLQLKSLNAELKRTDEQGLQSYMDFKAGTLTREEFLASRLNREERKAELKASITATEADYEACIRAEQEQEKEQKTTSKVGTLDDDALKGVLYDAIERVNIADSDQIEVTWKFNDIYKAV